MVKLYGLIAFSAFPFESVVILDSGKTFFFPSVKFSMFESVVILDSGKTHLYYS